jgi:RNA polymerase sigma-70 factor (ECF subfamily)
LRAGSQAAEGSADSVLVAAARRGDGLAFRRLMDRHVRLVYMLALRYLGSEADAHDAAQETFVRFHGSLNRFDEGAPVTPWLARIAVNVCRDVLKSVPRRVSAASQDASDDLPSREERTDERLEVAEVRARLHGEISRLPEKYREALLLRYVSDLDLAEMARATGQSVPTMKIRLVRGRDMLRRNLLLRSASGLRATEVDHGP